MEGMESPITGRCSQGFSLGCVFKLASSVAEGAAGAARRSSGGHGLKSPPSAAAPCADPFWFFTTGHASLKTHPQANLAGNYAIFAVAVIIPLLSASGLLR
jgi:hypothetical protein